MACGSRHAHRSEYKEAFSLFDTGNNGTVNVRDIGTVMRSLGQVRLQPVAARRVLSPRAALTGARTQNPTEAEVAELLKGVTGDTLDFAGFCKLLNSKFVTNAEAEQEILAAFKVTAAHCAAARLSHD